MGGKLRKFYEFTFPVFLKKESIAFHNQEAIVYLCSPVQKLIFKNTNGYRETT